MVLFPEHQEVFEVWRYVTVTSGWADPTWSLITSISGRAEPIGMEGESFVHNQSFNDISEIVITPVEYDSILLPDDHLVSASGKVRKIIGWPEVWGWEMPHLGIKVKRVQWERPST